jgi:hypothetical protein
MPRAIAKSASDVHEHLGENALNQSPSDALNRPRSTEILRRWRGDLQLIDGRAEVLDGAIALQLVRLEDEAHAKSLCSEPG